MTAEERKARWENILTHAPVMAQLMKDAKRLGISFTLQKVEVKQ